MSAGFLSFRYFPIYEFLFFRHWDFLALCGRDGGEVTTLPPPVQYWFCLSEPKLPGPASLALGMRLL